MGHHHNQLQQINRIAVLVGLLLCGSSFVAAEPQDDKSEQRTAEELTGWQRVFHEHASEYRIAEAQGDRQIELVSKPILQWSQPVRGGADGAVYVWESDGCPVVIGTFFIWPMGDGRQAIAHELHSLSSLPLDAKWKTREWTPPKDSITWVPFSEAPAPGSTVELRLRQMRELSRQFQAESHDKMDRKWDLRLLPRPIYRYGLDGDRKSSTGNDQDGIIDGALFGFVEGTDLEVVLLVQARKTAKGQYWEFALARMSDFKLRVTHQNETVWQAERSGYDTPRAPYFCSTVESRRSPDEK